MSWNGKPAWRCRAGEVGVLLVAERAGRDMAWHYRFVGLVCIGTRTEPKETIWKAQGLKRDGIVMNGMVTRGPGSPLGEIGNAGTDIISG